MCRASQSRSPRRSRRSRVGKPLSFKCSAVLTAATEVSSCHSVPPRCPRSVARFEETYRGIADRLELLGRSDPKIDTLKLARDWLCDEANGWWTMVVDHADDVEVFYLKRKRGRGGDSQDILAPLAAFLPQSRNGSISEQGCGSAADGKLQEHQGSSRHGRKPSCGPAVADELL